jgi:tetratricopeptide (TPR) repeat protein
MKALALARLGRHREAESAILEAFQLADAKAVPGMALLHWYAGLAFAAMGQPSKAREHFQKASALDPHGKYGNLAARWLEDDRRNSTIS